MRDLFLANRNRGAASVSFGSRVGPPRRRDHPTIPKVSRETYLSLAYSPGYCIRCEHSKSIHALPKRRSHGCSEQNSKIPKVIPEKRTHVL